MLRILLLIVAVVLIVLSLLQSGKSDGLSAFMGSGDLGLFQNVKERGVDLVISRLTMFAGALFFVISLALYLFFN